MGFFNWNEAIGHFTWLQDTLSRTILKFCFVIQETLNINNPKFLPSFFWVRTWYLPECYYTEYFSTAKFYNYFRVRSQFIYYCDGKIIEPREVCKYLWKCSIWIVFQLLDVLLFLPNYINSRGKLLLDSLNHRTHHCVTKLLIDSFLFLQNLCLKTETYNHKVWEKVLVHSTHRVDQE